MTSVSAIFEYVQPDIALNVVGATVLAGYPAHPWGQLGKGPVPPSLESLVAAGYNPEALDVVIDALFRLDSASPPMLLRDGALRPAVRCALASMIMYYGHRLKTGEMRAVVVSMRNVFARAGFAYGGLEGGRGARVGGEGGGGGGGGGGSSSVGASSAAGVDIDQVLIKMGSIIRMKWDVSNLHLTSRTSSPQMEQFVTVVSQLGKYVEDTRQSILDRLGSLEKQVSRLEVGIRSTSKSSNQVSQLHLTLILSNHV